MFSTRLTLPSSVAGDEFEMSAGATVESVFKALKVPQERFAAQLTQMDMPI
jgi:hypothetical protein